jgi:hypothetical protein
VGKKQGLLKQRTTLDSENGLVLKSESSYLTSQGKLEPSFFIEKKHSKERYLRITKKIVEDFITKPFEFAITFQWIPNHFKLYFFSFLYAILILYMAYTTHFVITQITKVPD